MPTQLFAPTTGAANSSDITVTASAPVAVSIKASGAIDYDTLQIQRKNSAGAYYTVKTLKQSQPGFTISGPGVYRVHKDATTNALGADQD